MLVPGFASHLDVMWEEPRLAAFLGLLAARARLILYDAREQGLSDRLGRAPTLEEHVDDLHAVLDEAGSEHAVLLGVSQGGPTAIAFAAEHPARTRGLALYGTYAKAGRGDDYPAGRRRIGRVTAPMFARRQRSRGWRVAASMLVDNQADVLIFLPGEGSHCPLSAFSCGRRSHRWRRSGWEWRCSLRRPRWVIHQE